MMKIIRVSVCSTLVACSMSLASAKGNNGLDVDAILDACKVTADATPAALRPGTTVMWCAVLDREGFLQEVKATDSGESACSPPPYTSDAIRISIEIAIAKAWTALSASSSATALDSKAVGLAARPDGPGSGLPEDIGTNDGKGSLFGVGDTNTYQRFFRGVNEVLCGQKHRGIVTFAGGQPIYECGTSNLIGAVGVSGDGVDQDDIVAKGAVTGAQGVNYCLEPNQ